MLHVQQEQAPSTYAVNEYSGSISCAERRSWQTSSSMALTEVELTISLMLVLLLPAKLDANFLS